MSLTPSTMLELGVQAPDFELPDVISGPKIRLSNYNDKEGTLVVFICNHCPYVKHIKKDLVKLAEDYADQIRVVAINSNDVEHYPQDRPEKMREDAETFNYPFPYLYDESQEVAKAYKASCTPDLFLVNDQQALVYRGQFDGSRPANGQPVTGNDIRSAFDQLLKDGSILDDQKPSMGCSIKWKPGNEPDYFG